MASRVFSISDHPNLDDLIQVAGKISAKLKYLELISFGLKLLSEEEVEEIQRDCGDGNLKKLCLEILTKWKGGKNHASWGDVVRALRSIGQHEVATIIEEAIQPSSTQLGKRPADERDGACVVPKRLHYENDGVLFEKLWTNEQLTEMIVDSISLPENIKSKVLEKVVVVLMAVNKSEKLAILSNLKALDGYDNVFNYSQRIDHAAQKSEIANYYIGNYGACPAAVRTILAGPEGDGGASSVPNMAFECFPSLDAIIGVGVACGVEEKVKMCDVLVSSRIAAYNSGRAEKGHIKSRAEIVGASAYLRDLFSNNFKWPSNTIKERLKSGNMRIPEIKSGVILSGPYLIDDSKIKEWFIEDFASEAIGIEMEGSYLCGGAKRTTTHLLIVKAVCDFGDGEKGKKYQPTAALLAADLVKESFDDPQVAEMLKKRRS